MPSRSNYYLREVKDRFMVNYANGGMSAVEQMVRDLDAESMGAKALADGGIQIADEAIIGQAALSDEEVKATIFLIHETALDSVTAMGRYSFAAWLLEIVKDRK